MLENESIPLVTQSEFDKAKRYMDNILDDVITEMKSYREDDEYDYLDDFENAAIPLDKKKIH